MAPTRPGAYATPTRAPGQTLLLRRTGPSTRRPSATVSQVRLKTTGRPSPGATAATSAAARPFDLRAASTSAPTTLGSTGTQAYRVPSAAGEIALGRPIPTPKPAATIPCPVGATKDVRTSACAFVRPSSEMATAPVPTPASISQATATRASSVRTAFLTRRKVAAPTA